ncbi:TPA: DUF4303 domain-containing protein [Pseudomonas putida]|nr:DUF4303 domain-containing protein [Pseudomonas putida]
MNYNNLKEKIKTATIAVAERMANEFPEGEVCAFALYSDADARTLAPSLNLRSNLEAMQSGDPDDAIYYKWAPAEWSHEAYAAELFDGISEELAGLSDSMSPEQDFEAHCERIFQICVDVLDEVRPMFLPGKIVVFAVSDMVRADWECKWIAQLNSAEEAREFESWMNSL